MKIILAGSTLEASVRARELGLDREDWVNGLGPINGYHVDSEDDIIEVGTFRSRHSPELADQLVAHARSRIVPPAPEPAP